VWIFSVATGQYAQLPRGRRTLATWRPPYISSRNISRASVSPLRYRSPHQGHRFNSASGRNSNAYLLVRR
jgi:hypothetical protein